MAFPGRCEGMYMMKDSAKSVGRILCEFANGRKVDFLIIGMFGRKGIKDQTDTVCASNANYALQYASCSTILIEQPFLPYTQVHYCVAMDRTKSSEKALVDALLLSEPGDKISILHVKMRDEESRANDAHETPDVICDFEERIARLLHKWATCLKRPREVGLFLLDETDRPPAEDILDWVITNNVHFMCVGADQERLRRRQHYLGSVSATIVVNLVREGVPVCVAHYDGRFYTEGVKDELPPKAEVSPSSPKGRLYYFRRTSKDGVEDGAQF